MCGRSLGLSAVWVIALLLLASPIVGQETDVDRLARQAVTLRPGDVLVVRVWPDTSLGGEFSVEETGFVYLPLVGRVKAAGVSIQNLRARLREEYSTVMKSPVVTVTPRFSVAVLGEVRGPGVYSVTSTSSVLDVIAQAGGFTPRANQERLRLVRDNRLIEFDALRNLSTELRASRMHLQSGDEVIVPRRSGGVTFGTVLDALQTAATIGFLVDRLIDP